MDDLDFDFIQSQNKHLDKLIMDMGQPKYKAGDDVLYVDSTTYRIIHEAEQLKEFGKWIRQYGACKLLWDHTPDREYLRAPGPNEHVGRFKIFVIREDFILQKLIIEKMKEFRNIPATVFPSDEFTVAVAPDADYDGAHNYRLKESTGFANGKASYVESYQEIQFVQKNTDGSMTTGLQSEQLLIALIDRHKKLNNKFPSREGALAITKMEEALQWLRARVEERINRGVMGDLKK